MQYRRDCTDTTIVTYKAVLGQFLAYLGNIEVYQLNIASIDSFADHLLKYNFAPKTYRNKLCIIRSFTKYLYSKELANVRPESVEVPPERKQEVAYLTELETEQLLSVITNKRDYAMILFLLTTGVRVSELIKVQHGDMFRGTVRITNGKGRKHRVVFIPERTIKALKRYSRASDGYLFPNPYGNSLSRVVVARKVKYYADKAGIKKKVSVHTLRHSFATMYLDRGGRIEDLQQILGHEDIKTTMIYLHFTNERLHNAYNTVMA